MDMHHIVSSKCTIKCCEKDELTAASPPDVKIGAKTFKKNRKK